MKIVVLDGEAMNPGDLSWDGIARHGEFIVYDRTPPELTFERAFGAEIVFTNKTLLNAETLKRLEGLRYIGLFSTGTNTVDLAAARACGVPVTNIPAYSTNSVAQLTFAHVLNLSFMLSEHADSVREGNWSRHIDFCYWNYPLIELSGLRFGSVGCGAIGTAAMKIAAAFGMEAMGCDSKNTTGKRDDGIAMVELKTILKTCDVVSLHCPLTAANAKMINAETLALMKPGAFLINTSRGGLIDEPALAAALNEGRLGGAGLDVLSTEPPPNSNPLLKAKNCFITPHIAWGTLAARTRLMKVVVENLDKFLDGTPQNVVN